MLPALLHNGLDVKDELAIDVGCWYDCHFVCHILFFFIIAL